MSEPVTAPLKRWPHSTIAARFSGLLPPDFQRIDMGRRIRSRLEPVRQAIFDLIQENIDDYDFN